VLTYYGDGHCRKHPNGGSWQVAMHNRARYKENLRKLVVSWNERAADENKIDLSGFADAVTLPGQPLRLRNRRARTACDKSSSDDQDEAGVAAAAAEALADVSRSSG
jgi:hypothetical protein